MKINNLEVLSDEQKVAFAALTCERMLPLYELFSNACEFGSSNLYKRCISLLYNYCFGVVEDFSDYERELKNIELLVPDLDDFSESIASFGSDSALCLFEAFSFLIDKEVIHIRNLSTHALDTVDMYVQIAYDLNPNDVNIESIIRDNMFMINEISLQNTLRDILLARGVSKESINYLRQLNAKNNIVDLDVLGRFE